MISRPEKPKKQNKNEVFNANFGSLNKIFGNSSCLNGFRYVWIFFKTKSVNFLTIRGSCGWKYGEKLTKFGFFEFCLVDLNVNYHVRAVSGWVSREKLQIVWLGIQITFYGSGGKNWYFLVNLTILNLQLQTVNVFQCNIRSRSKYFLYSLSLVMM